MTYMATTRAGSLLCTVYHTCCKEGSATITTLICTVSFMFDALHNVILDSGPDYPPKEEIYCCISPEILKTGS